MNTYGSRLVPSFPYIHYAYDTYIVGFLGKKEGQAYYAIYFVSKNLAPVELNYTVTEK